MSTTAVVGCEWLPTLGQPVKQVIPSCQRLQKTHPLIAWMDTFLKLLLVFSPFWSRIRWMGRGFWTGFPSRP